MPDTWASNSLAPNLYQNNALFRIWDAELESKWFELLGAIFDLSSLNPDDGVCTLCSGHFSPSHPDHGHIAWQFPAQGGVSQRKFNMTLLFVISSIFMSFTVERSKRKYLKGVWHHFLTSGFFHESISPGRLRIPWVPFRIFTTIDGDI